MFPKFPVGQIAGQITPQMNPGQTVGLGFLAQPQMPPAMQPAGIPQPGVVPQQPTAPQSAPATGAPPKVGSLTSFKNPAPNYKFVGAEDSLQAMVSASHVGVVLLGTACLLGGCIGMALAGGDEESEEEEK